MDQLDLGAPSMWTSPTLSGTSMGDVETGCGSTGTEASSRERRACGEGDEHGRGSGKQEMGATGPMRTEPATSPPSVPGVTPRPQAPPLPNSRNKLKRLSLVSGLSSATRHSLDSVQSSLDSQDASGPTLDGRLGTARPEESKQSPREGQSRQPLASRSGLSSPRRVEHVRRQSSISYSPSSRQRIHPQLPRSAHPDLGGGPYDSTIPHSQPSHTLASAPDTVQVGLGLGEINTLNRSTPTPSNLGSKGETGRTGPDVKQARRQSMATMGYGAYSRRGHDKGGLGSIEEKAGVGRGAGAITLTEQYVFPSLLTVGLEWRWWE